MDGPHKNFIIVKLFTGAKSLLLFYHYYKNTVESFSFGHGSRFSRKTTVRDYFKFNRYFPPYLKNKLVEFKILINNKGIEFICRLNEKVRYQTKI